jgi:predicted MFS family arabinose efflux permease
MHQNNNPPVYLSWLIWGLGVAFYFTGFFHRMVPAVMTDQLMADFGIGAAALGNLASFYYYSYVAVQIPTGILADHWGPRKLLTAGCLLSSLGALLFASAPSILLANLGRLLIGGSIGVAWVALLKLTTRWFKPDRFATATGLALAIGICGALSAGVPLRLLVDSIGWRPAIFAAGLVTLLLSAAIWTFVRDDPFEKGYTGFVNSAANSPADSHLSPAIALGRVFQYRNTWLLTLVPSGLVGPLLTFTGLWGVPFLTARYDLSPVQSAAITSVVLIAWAVGGPVLGALSDRIGRRKSVYFCALSIATMAWGLVLISQRFPLWFMIAVLVVVGFASSSIIIGFAFAKESVPTSWAGTVTGVCNMGMEMGPMILQPVIGWVLDRTWDGMVENGTRVYNLDAYHSGFALMTGWALLATVLLIFTKETYCRQTTG